MAGTVTCPSCSHGVAVQPGGRLPPWCSACGAALGGAGATGPSAGPQPLSPAPGAPRYFHACVPQVFQNERLTTYRFYVTGDELLAFPAGLGSIKDGRFFPQTGAGRVIGGIGHGALQTRASQVEGDLHSRREAEGTDKLDGASDEVLSMAARQVAGAVPISTGELRGVRIEAPGLLFTFLRGITCEAVLKLGHPTLGTLALPSLTDARRAVEGLKGLLGAALTVNLPWGKKS